MIKVIGHRGNKEEYLENTLLGFKSVMEDNYIDGLEFDIVITKDYKLVANHDEFIIINKQKIYIHTLTYAELLSYGSKMKKEDKKGERFPLLEDVLELYSNYPGKKDILLEIKSLPGVIEEEFLCVMVANIYKNLLEYNVKENLTVISFDYRVLLMINKLDSSIKLGQILHRNLIPLSCVIDNLPISILVVPKLWITKEEVKIVNKNSIKVYVWTANKQEEWDMLIKLGVDAIITDSPNVLKKYTGG